MTETMTAQVTVPCPSCARPMGFENNSWRCMACNPEPMNIPICATQKCKRPLTKLPDPWNCWICLKCNKHPAVVNKMRKQDDQRKAKYLDKKVTEERVSEMIKEGIADGVRAAMAEYNVNQAEGGYPPAQTEITQIAESVLPNATPVETYLQKAKRLGVATHIPTGGMRKKVEIMADIEAKERPVENVDNEEIAEDEETRRKAGMKAPSDDDEYARGLTAKDMM